jgi:hypothetical protein
METHCLSLIQVSIPAHVNLSLGAVALFYCLGFMGLAALRVVSQGPETSAKRHSLVQVNLKSLSHL